jgi:hypothetical protein
LLIAASCRVIKKRSLSFQLFFQSNSLLVFVLPASSVITENLAGHTFSS